eukprot:GDKK01034960.1.p1 GENE.GDKK01034960.1~~GDKK01034960.1.p1  ORF type:complete len:151 (-),score=30.90 GDKK01034960.1:44-460(-)
MNDEAIQKILELDVSQLSKEEFEERSLSIDEILNCLQNHRQNMLQEIEKAKKDLKSLQSQSLYSENGVEILNNINSNVKKMKPVDALKFVDKLLENEIETSYDVLGDLESNLSVKQQIIKNAKPDNASKVVIGTIKGI